MSRTGRKGVASLLFLRAYRLERLHHCEGKHKGHSQGYGEEIEDHVESLEDIQEVAGNHRRKKTA